MTIKKQLTTKNIKIQNKNLEILKKNFSHCFNKEGNFDFKKFKQELSKNKDIDFSNESYGMDWLGKNYARLLASDEARTLLKEDEAWNQKQENKKSENLLIKGDNLEVLKHLSNAYYEKIKMIYIDPPYNTGGDGFVYEDDRKFSIEELSKLAGINEDKAKRILDFTQSKSNSHSAWLTFMYPRLYIAKQLLKDDGVIFISIDDNEVAQLRLLMDEIFGEENFISEIIWQKNFAPKNDNKYISTSQEYILMFSKHKNLFDRNLLPREKKHNTSYKNPDNDLRGVWTSGSMLVTTFSEKGVFEIIAPNGEKHVPPKGRCWRFSKQKIEELLNDNRIWFGKDLKGVPRIKRFLSEMPNGIVPQSLLLYQDVGSGQDASSETKKLFDNKMIFDFPKPTKLLKRFLHISTKKDDIILDFFAGSGATADAMMQLNAEDGGNRKFILVQLPEKIDKKKNKTAYDFVKNDLKKENPTIFDITKERLIRVGKKIQEDNKKSKEPKDLSYVDFGFKLFETTPIWEDYNLEAESFDPQIKLFDESKLSKGDFKTLLTTWKTYDGFSLTQNLKEIDLDSYIGYYFDNKLYLMDKGFETKHLKKLLEEIDENKDFNPATIIVFGYNFQSKMLREIADNIKSYANKKHIDIDFITRY
jgi:adenine-specific DNA-methyltransferase